MKNAKLFLSALAFSALMFSCSDDDDNGGSSTGGNIEARWNPSRTIIELNGEEVENETYNENQAGCAKDYVEFANPNVVNFVVYVEGAGGECETSSAEPGTWTKNDDTLIVNDLLINGQDFSGTYEITRLTGSELRIQTETTSGGATLTSKIYFTKATNQED